MSEVREFILDKANSKWKLLDGQLYHSPRLQLIHAIEYSAFEALQKRCTELEGDVDDLREALEVLIGASKNSLVARGLPLEWTETSGIGVGERALSKLNDKLEEVK